MKKITLVFICTFLVGCASDPDKRKLVAIEESSGMQSTSEPLSSFDNFKLADMTLAPSVQTEPEKVVVAKRLDVKLKTKLDPLISNWNAKSGYVQGGRMVEIQPRVVLLRVISGTTRFFAGAWSIGMTDKSLLDYIVDIADQYLVDNYQEAE